MKGKSTKTATLVFMITAFLALSVFLGAFKIATSSPETIFYVDPPSIIDVTKTPGTTITVQVKVLDAYYLYSWQVYMEWYSTMLSTTSANVVFSGFLTDQPEGSTTNKRVETGWLLIAETTKGAYLGKSAPSGTLVSITFSVLSTGETILNIDNDWTYYMKCEVLPTLVKVYPTRENGYFSNILPVIHNLTVNSDPTSGIDFTVDGAFHTTPWSGSLSEGAHTVVMPSTWTVGTDTYQFDHWEDMSTDPTRIVSLVADTTITAYYVFVPPVYWTLTVNSDPIYGIDFTVDGTPHTTHWSGSLLEGSHTVVMPLTWTTGTGDVYYFDHWEDVSTSPTRIVSLTADKTITAYYVLAPVEWTLTVYSDPISGVDFTLDGVFHTTPYSASLIEGSHTIVMPSTWGTYNFDHWDDVSTNPTRVISLTADKTVTAYYVLAPPPPPSEYTRIYLPNQWISNGVAMGWHADDASWAYYLPFDFPFYGTYYRTIYISSNGLITFTGPDSSFWNSITELSYRLAIAPAWDDWVSYEPYDIYIWQPDPAHVIIRWYVRLIGTSIVANFETILGRDGVIQFNYGYNDGPISSTVGISNGVGDILAEDITISNYINSILFTPYRPEHDLEVWAEAPAYLRPLNTAVLNATVVNRGLSDEFDVELQLLIDDVVVNSVTIPELPTGSSYRLSHLWTPTIEGTYNVTAYAPPMPAEDIISNNVQSARVTVTSLLVAIFQNRNPWGYTANQEILSLNGIPYVVFTSADFDRVDLSQYSRVVIPSVQDQTFYNAMNNYKWWFEDYVRNGGVLEIHAAHYSGEGWVGTLPGDLQYVQNPRDYVTIVDSSHPVVTRPNHITDSELDGWIWSVHGCFTIYPADSRIVIIEDSTGFPAYLEFGYGAGFILASSQTLEWAYGHGYSRILENSLLYTPLPPLQVSISPQTGPVGTLVTLTGSEATPHAQIEIYWENTIMGTTIADADGNFSFTFTIPSTVTGTYKIKAVETATQRSGRATFNVIPSIRLDPTSGPIGTKLMVNGYGFVANTTLIATFDDTLTAAWVMTDGTGSFTAVINVPICAAGPHTIKAFVYIYRPPTYQPELLYAEATFTLIDVTPLEVNIDVGAIFFKGETAEFYVQTVLNGKPVDVTLMNAALYKPDGTTQTLTYQRIAPGLYKISYTISGKSAMTGTYTLVVEASYTTPIVNAYGTSIKTFLVKPAWQQPTKTAALSIASVGLVAAIIMLYRRKEEKPFP